MKLMHRPGCFLLAVIVIIAAIFAAVVLGLSTVAPVLKAHQADQTDQENK